MIEITVTGKSGVRRVSAGASEEEISKDRVKTV